MVDEVKSSKVPKVALSKPGSVKSADTVTESLCCVLPHTAAELLEPTIFGSTLLIVIKVVLSVKPSSLSMIRVSNIHTQFASKRTLALAPPTLDASIRLS